MTSNEKFQPGEETFEDVEAHGFRGNVGSEEPTDDVEGHMPRVRIALPEEPTEDDGDGDDTEGHGVRVQI